MKQESERQRNENNVLGWWCCASAPRRAAVGCRFLLPVVSASLLSAVGQRCSPFSLSLCRAVGVDARMS